MRMSKRKNTLLFTFVMRFRLKIVFANQIKWRTFIRGICALNSWVDKLIEINRSIYVFLL